MGYNAIRSSFLGWIWRCSGVESNPRRPGASIKEGFSCRHIPDIGVVGCLLLCAVRAALHCLAEGAAGRRCGDRERPCALAPPCPGLQCKLARTVRPRGVAAEWRRAITDARRAGRGQCAGWRPSNGKTEGRVVWCGAGQCEEVTLGRRGARGCPPALLLGGCCVGLAWRGPCALRSHPCLQGEQSSRNRRVSDGLLGQPAPEQT